MRYLKVQLCRDAIVCNIEAFPGILRAKGGTVGGVWCDTVTQKDNGGSRAAGEGSAQGKVVEAEVTVHMFAAS